MDSEEISRLTSMKPFETNVVMVSLEQSGAVRCINTPSIVILLFFWLESLWDQLMFPFP